ARNQIGPGVAGVRVRRQGQIGVEAPHRNVEHRQSLSFPGVLVWMDLEMTGLDPACDTIVEIATLITDDNLEVVAEGPDLVVAASAEALAHMSEFVRAMHTRSGLLTAIAESTVTLDEAGARTLEFIKEHAPEASTVPLCGNSIGTD